MVLLVQVNYVLVLNILYNVYFNFNYQKVRLAFKAQLTWLFPDSVSGVTKAFSASS